MKEAGAHLQVLQAMKDGEDSAQTPFHHVKLESDNFPPQFVLSLCTLSVIDIFRLHTGTIPRSADQQCEQVKLAHTR